MTRKEKKETVYVVTTTEGFIPHSRIYRTKDKALECAKDYTEIQRIIHNMMIENTGAHFLDSGGAYGRNWERNRAIPDMRPDKPTLADVWGKVGAPADDYSFTVSLFAYLTGYLEINETSERLNELFDMHRDANPDDREYLLMQTFNPGDYDPEYSEFEHHGGGNSYNHETTLSQDIQFDWLSDERFNYYNPAYIMLQIHGGYTEPKIFYVPDPAAFVCGWGDLYADCKCTHLSAESAGYYWFGEYSNDQRSIDGSRLNPCPDNELPNHWIIIEKDQDNPDHAQYTEKALRCKLCGATPNFSAPLW